jgi:hypothetical protein
MTVTLLAYGALMIYCTWSYARNFGALLVAEARAEHQNEVIALLLRDFEDHASDLLWELDLRGRFTRVSDKLAGRLGVPPRGCSACAPRCCCARSCPSIPTRMRTGRPSWA